MQGRAKVGLGLVVALAVGGGCANGGSGSSSSSSGSSSGSSSSTSSSSGQPPVYQTTQGLTSCAGATLEAGTPLQPGQRCFTYRALGGVSMGGGSAARIAFHYPELFDAVGVMGTPFSDFDYFYNMLATNHLDGFCPREQILQLLADNPGNPDILDDPNAAGVWCGQHGANIPGDLAEPDTQCYMFRSDFNHWYRGPDAGRGGGFKRPSLLEIIQDIMSTYGNVIYHNPDSPYMPPGVPDTMRVPPSLNGSAKNDRRSQICSNPVVLEGVKHLEWNPDGTYPLITFCDCSTCDGDYIPGRADMPAEVMLAVDYNRNGRRDYAEPVVWMGHERFQDVGVDGKATGEMGDDPMDDYDYLNNPAGTENNLRHDEGEPFDDNGLDGVPNTGDYGEGDGLYTMTPALERALADSPTRWFNAMEDAMVQRLDVWMDAGIRDFINSAQITNQLFGAIKAREADTRMYRDFSGLAQLPLGFQYQFTDVDFSASSIGRNAYTLYGNPGICPGSDDNLGDGNHVGPANQVIQRLLTLFAFVDARMPGGDRSYINSSSAADDHPDGFSAHLRLETYASAALGHAQEFGLVLPPGYFYPENADKRYPVIYFLHGQGQSAQDMIASGAIFMGYMHQSSLPNVFDRSDLQKFILIFADGECQESNDDCHTGNFYSDFVGPTGNGPQYEQAFLELMRHVDVTYRTRMPEVH